MMSPRIFLRTAGAQANNLVHRVRHALEHQRRAQLITSLLISIGIASFATEAVMTQRHLRQQWSTEHTVLVATRDVEPGDAFTSDNTALVSLPHAITAEDVLTSVPEHRRARIALTARTPLTLSVTVPTSESVTVPEGWRVVALPPDAPVPALQPGDAVDVVSSSGVVASDCVVVSVSPIAVAAPVDVIPSIVATSRVGELAVVLKTR